MRFSHLSTAVWASSLPQALAAAYKPDYSKYNDGACVDVDVAVIGGGSAGIHAAIHLKDAGAKVVVIEKKSQIGGHAETYVNPKTKIPANIGVVLFEDTTIVQNYFDRLKVASTKVSPADLGGETKTYDFTLGIPVPAQSEAQQAASQQAIGAAVLAYTQNVLSKYPWVDQGYLVPQPVPKELTLPFGEFARKYKFEALLPVISQFNWYPGNITTIPALYGIKSLGPGLLKSFTAQFIVPKSGDTRSLYRAAATELGSSVLLNSDVLYVDRHDKGVTLVVKQKNQKPKKINARKLVVAIPQTIKNVGNYDLSTKERSLFSKFSAFTYIAGVANIPGLDVSLQNVGAFTPANVPLIPGSNGFSASGSPGQFLLGVAFDGADYTVEDGKAVIRRELTTLAKVGGVPADAAKKVTFPYLSNHAPYNLRVSGKEIAAGFYHQLLSLEGSRNTYWTGAAFAGHNSGAIWTWNEDTLLPQIKKDLGL
ncbi:flavin-containing superfamily amine oxidase [Fusarium albosuccineum]|uniref:Flavin-containing superfamily amine oxidase n=1 Tax=Fusarium albosuccineum TaxID=1237068 RepID=A0A8H4P506_9HYPO|nr:flavin-containing superfamily amine oxidase [Fusarium albosuccineum]